MAVAAFACFARVLAAGTVAAFDVLVRERPVATFVNLRPSDGTPRSTRPPRALAIERQIEDGDKLSLATPREQMATVLSPGRSCHRVRAECIGVAQAAAENMRVGGAVEDQQQSGFAQRFEHFVERNLRRRGVDDRDDALVPGGAAGGQSPRGTQKGTGGGRGNEAHQCAIRARMAAPGKFTAAGQRATAPSLAALRATDCSAKNAALPGIFSSALANAFTASG